MKRLGVLAAIVPSVVIGALPASAGVLGPTKASALVHSVLYDGPAVPSCPGNANEVVLSTSPAVGQVLVVTGFSWRIAWATPNSSASVTLIRSNGTGGFINLVQSLAIANAAGEAAGSESLQPGVVALKPVDGFTHLCIAQNSPLPGTLTIEGSLQGYIAPDK